MIDGGDDRRNASLTYPRLNLTGEPPKALENARENAAAEENPVRAAMSAMATRVSTHQPPRRIEAQPEIIGARRLADRFAEDRSQACAAVTPARLAIAAMVSGWSTCASISRIACARRGS